ncbi:MAG: insulinase family protein [Clostridia bacterium]|nr:insulinase family protein [Clostridia bacterium]
MYQIEKDLCGFRLENRRFIDEVKADLYELTHVRSGAQLVWLAREDNNKTFGIAFKTLPEDSTGVFHILEHSVLNGSDKYQTREPFVDLLKGSLQTFLNAMTFPDKTFYPVCSRNDKDFLNLVSVYMDAVLHPAIYHKPEIFRQEGIHIELLEADAEPTYKGVVFNEMKGAYSSPDSLMVSELDRALFPDTCYRFSSGGDPVVIPDLTYEKFIESHQRFYHPSNSRIFLDGDMDIPSVLNLLDSFLADFEATDPGIVLELQAPVSPEEVTAAYEIGPEENAEGKVRYATGYVYGTYEDAETGIALRVLSDVLTGSNEAPLKRAILSRGLAEDVILEMNDGIYQPYAILGVSNTSEEKLPEIKKVIAETLADLAENGLDKAQLTASFNRLEFNTRERDYGATPRGLVYGMVSLETWLYDGDPADALRFNATFDSLREKLATNYYEELIRRIFLENNHKASACLIPSKTIGEERRAAEAARLAAIKATWTEEDKNALVAMNKALAEWQATPDTKEQLDTLPKLFLSDISEKEEKIPTIAEGNVIRHPIPSDGISYLSLYFSEAGLTERQLSLASLLCELLTEMDTETHDRLALQREIKTNLGRLTFSQTNYTDIRDTADVCHPYLAVKCSVLSGNTDKAIQLVAEIANTTVYNNKENIKQIVDQVKTGLMQNMIMGGHGAAMSRAMAHLNSGGVANESTGGYSYYTFCRDLSDNFEAKADELIAELAELAKVIFDRARLTVSLTDTDAETSDVPAKALAAFADSGKEIPASTAFAPLAPKNEGIVTPAGVSFAVMASDLKKNGYEFDGSMKVLAKILSLGYLWNEIRVKGGAYGAGFLLRESGNAAFYSYRDPGAARSLGVYKQASDFIRAFVESGEDVTKFVIGTIGDSEPVLSTSAKGSVADTDYFSGRTYEDRLRVRRQILATDAEALLRHAAALDSIAANAAICIVGGKDKLDACADTIEETLNL